MKNPSQDIYGTDRRKPEFKAASDMERVELLSKPYTDAVRRQRRATLLLSAVSILIVLLVGTVAVQQYFLLNQRAYGPGLNRPSVRRSVDAPTELTPQAQFLADELAAEQPLTIPEKGDLPLNATWVKQAAYYILQAEKATAEDRSDDALAAYGKALLIFPALKGAYRQMGLIHLRMKNYRTAAEMFENVLAQEEATFGVVNNLGVAYLQLEDNQKAEQNFLRAIQLNPQYPLPHFNLATLYRRARENEKAATHFEKYLSLRGDDVEAAQTYAALLLDLQRWERAVTLLQGISRAAPDVPPIQFQLAQALSHTPNRAAAMDALRRGATLVDPRKALAWMSKPELDLLRSDPGFQQLRDELGAAD